MPTIFLSHNHSDKPFVRRLERHLRRFGAKVWVDEGEIALGESLLEKIEAGLHGADFLGVVLSPRSVASDWVQRELKIAMEARAAGRGIRFIPMVIEDCELPGFLHGWKRADFRMEPQYNAQMRQVAETMGLEVPKEAGDPGVYWTWLRTAVARNDAKLFRNALYGFMTAGGEMDRNAAADILGGQQKWPEGFASVAAGEFLDGMEFEGDEGLASVRLLEELGKQNRGMALPQAVEDALASGDPVRRIGAAFFCQLAEQPSGIGGADARVVAPDRSQPLHLRMAAAHLCAWNVLNPILEKVGEECRLMQAELVHILERASRQAASSLALPGLKCVIEQVDDRWLRYLAASRALEIMPKLVDWAQDEHADLFGKAGEIVREWRNPASAAL